MTNFESVPPPSRVTPPAPPVRRSRFTVPPERRGDVAASGFLVLASSAVSAIEDPVSRAAMFLICGVAVYLLGRFQEKPRGL